MRDRCQADLEDAVRILWCRLGRYRDRQTILAYTSRAGKRQQSDVAKSKDFDQCAHFLVAPNDCSDDGWYSDQPGGVTGCLEWA